MFDVDNWGVLMFDGYVLLFVIVVAGVFAVGISHQRASQVI